MTLLLRLGLPLPAPIAYAAAVFSGLLYWLAFPGVDAWPLAFVAWVPLILALHGQPARRSMLLGGAAGITMNVAGFLWLQQMLETFSGFPAPICFLFVLLVCAYQGGRIALLGWIHGRATARNWPEHLVFGAAFAASELVYPLLFPWYYSATVHQVPVLMQLADVGGPIAVGLVLVTVNLAVAELALARLQGRRRVRATFAAAGVTLGLACVYGALRIPAVEKSTRRDRRHRPGRHGAHGKADAVWRRAAPASRHEPRASRPPGRLSRLERDGGDASRK